MRVSQDWRVWAGVLAVAAVLLAAAVAFASSGFPVRDDGPALPSVVTERPAAAMPATATPGVRGRTTAVAASRAAARASAGTSSPEASPRPKGAAQPDERSSAPPVTAARTRPGGEPDTGREVVSPKIREQSVPSDDEREEGARTASDTTAVAGTIDKTLSEPGEGSGRTAESGERTVPHEEGSAR